MCGTVKTGSGILPVWLNKRQNEVQVDLTCANCCCVIACYCCSTQDFGETTSKCTAHGPPVQQSFPPLLPHWSAAARYLIASADQINITLQGRIWFLPNQSELLSCCEALCFIGRFATTWPRTPNFTDVSTSHWQIRDAILVWSLLTVMTSLQSRSVFRKNVGAVT
jgi:hypothetical protein